MHLTEMLTRYAEHLINTAGYLGAFILMALESMIAPIPSEAVMPFIGMGVRKGTFDPTVAMLVTTAGSLVGSLISYWLGAVGGKPLVLKVGKFLFLNEHHLDLTIAWFHKKGGTWTVFLSRFIPVVRHLISVPAGIGKMPLMQFVAVTVCGAALWNGFLLFVGYQWESHLKDLEGYYKVLDYIVVLVGVIVVGAWIYTHMKKPAAKEVVEQK